jgi:hypothetical protein
MIPPFDLNVPRKPGLSPFKVGASLFTAFIKKKIFPF